MFYDFTHFLDAQEPMYAIALSELKAGKKQNHWIWYIFPQTPKVGMGKMALYFALHSKEEAQAYLQHPVLGKRLCECTKAVLSHPDKSLEMIFGTALDAQKFKSSMMLFSHVDESGLFRSFTNIRDK